jgi:multidrug efflux pump subunit AcrA (membrane-fusion protein)
MQQLSKLAAILSLVINFAFAEGNFYTVTKTYFNDKESFSSVIYPWSIKNVYTEEESKLVKIHSEVGDYISKGDALFTIKPTRLTKEITDLVIDYFEKKEKLSIIKSKYELAKQQYEEGSVDKKEYRESKILLSKSDLQLKEMEREIKAKLENKEISIDFNKLDITNIKDICNEIFVGLKQITYKSPSNGIVLDNLSLGKESSKLGRLENLTEGAHIPNHTNIIGVAGNDEIKVVFSVPETKFEDIKVGQKVTISGLAFQGIYIKGEVNKISQQAFKSNGSNLSQFLVTVKAQLPSEYLSKIKTGMTAKATINYEEKSRIAIPIIAISLDSNNKSKVTVVNNEGEMEERKIITGTLKEDLIEIKDGLYEGEIVVLPN